jgi:hypothetical protein
MKKTKKALAFITSMALFTCAAVVPMSVDAAIVTDNTRSEFDKGAEKVRVRINYNYDVSIPKKVKEEVIQKAQELTAEHFSEIDTSNYSSVELMHMKSEYYSERLDEISKESEAKAKKELITPIFNDIGADITENIEYPFYGVIYCDLNAEQLSKAEKNETISSISVDSDWNNEVYVGTPSITPEMSLTTSTFASSTSASTTTTTVTTSEAIVTTLEYSSSDMFTDTVEEINDFTITFVEHGKYRYLSDAIRDQLKNFEIGDEITIGFEYLKVNDADIPRIDNIFMLDGKKSGTTTVTTATTSTTTTPTTTTTTKSTTSTSTTSTTRPVTTATTSMTTQVTTTTGMDTDASNMFTDIIEDMGNNTITFKEHGKFRYEANEIANKLKAYKAGDEIIIGFDAIKLHSKDTPRIDNIFMLSYAELALGDMNGDRHIDAIDATCVLAEYSLLSTGGTSSLTSSEKTAADVNKDNKIDANDATLILGMYAYNSTTLTPFETMEEYFEHINNTPKWTEIKPSSSTQNVSASYKLFNKDTIIDTTDLVFKGTITNLKEYEIEAKGENGEKLGPFTKSIVEVTVDEVYHGEINKDTIKIYYPTSLSTHYDGSFILRENQEYIFLTNDISEAIDKKYNVKKYADTSLSAGLRNGVMPVIDNVVSVYEEYFNNDESAMSKAIPQDDVLDKMPEEARGKWFLTFNKNDFVELLGGLFKNNA